MAALITRTRRISSDRLAFTESTGCGIFRSPNSAARIHDGHTVMG